MGRGLVNASWEDVSAEAMRWFRSSGYRVHTDGSGLCGTGRFLRVFICGCTREHRMAVSVCMRLRLGWNLLLYGILLGLLALFAAFSMEFLPNPELGTFGLLTLVAVLAIGILVWRSGGLSRRLVRAERAFWDSLAERYDVERMTRSHGAPTADLVRLAVELVFAGGLAVFGWMCFGWVGLLGMIALCTPILIMMSAGALREEHRDWHWRLWVIDGMASWTFLAMFMLGAIGVLTSADVILGLDLQEDESSSSVLKAIRQVRLRKVSPTTVEALESDVRRIFWEIATRDMEDQSWGEQWENFETAVGTFLAIILITVGFCVVWPFSRMLSLSRRWADQLGTEGQAIPHVPYFTGASRREVPLVLKCLVGLHWIFGGAIQIIVGLFCLEGLAYAILGRPLLWSGAANLWSWVFGTPTALFTVPVGRTVGVILFAIIASPMLLLFAAWVRRTLRAIWIRLTARKEFPRRSEMMTLIMKVCNAHNIRPPLFRWSRSRHVLVHLHGMWPGGRCVLEISKSAVDLLSEDELLAAVAHELGHVKQGLWKVTVLKILSSLALFPNHYLTVCLNWPAMEMEADRFAVVIMGSSDSLKRALVKISAAQMNYFRQVRPKANDGRDVGRLRKFLRIRYLSIRFFYGDSLLGYVHPHLTERLEALGHPAREHA